MILPISENVFCFGKERNSKTIKIINYIFGEIWTIGIMNLILKDKTDSVMPESFVLSQKCAALIVRRFSSISSSHAQTQM
jgi:glucose uptake protein GlcU